MEIKSYDALSNSAIFFLPQKSRKKYFIIFTSPKLIFWNLEYKTHPGEFLLKIGSLLRILKS